MPNHIINRLEVISTPSKVKKVMEFIKGPERIIDFNKIIPMPESLLINIHSGVEMAVKNALQMKPHENGLIAALEIANRKNTKSPLVFNDEEWSLFIQCLNNVKKYGYIYWYDWSVENWGTKWNAYDQKRESDNTIIFETAWCGVVGLIQSLSAKFPDVKFYYEYSDEDTGNNCGLGYIKDGVSEVKILKDGSKEAYELAFKLRPENKKYYVLEGNTYKYEERE